MNVGDLHNSIACSNSLRRTIVKGHFKFTMNEDEIINSLSEVKVASEAWGQIEPSQGSSVVIGDSRGLDTSPFDSFVRLAYELWLEETNSCLERGIGWIMDLFVNNVRFAVDTMSCNDCSRRREAIYPKEIM